MSKGFAEQSGGGFTIESALGQGTTVMLWLLLAVEGAAARPLVTDRLPRKGLAGTSGAASPRLLVADNESEERETREGDVGSVGEIPNEPTALARLLARLGRAAMSRAWW